jgi:hypothetical protein
MKPRGNCQSFFEQIKNLKFLLLYCHPSLDVIVKKSKEQAVLLYETIQNAEHVWSCTVLISVILCIYRVVLLVYD